MRLSFIAYTLALLLSACLVSPAFGGEPAADSTRDPLYAPGRVIVAVEQGLSRSDVERIASGVGAIVQKQIGRRDIYLLTFDPSVSVLDVIQKLETAPGVRIAQPDFRVELLDDVGSTGNTPPQTGSRSGASSGKVVVAVIDTGINWEHPKLKNSIWTNEKEIPDNGIDDDKNGYTDDLHGYNFPGGTPLSVGDETPRGAHGTFVAQVIQSRDAGIPSAGVFSLMSLQTYHNGVGPYVSDIVEALYYAVDNGARVINMSLGGPSPLGEIMTDAIQYATSRGVVLVASAGNTGSDRGRYPASYDEVISVAATDQAGKKARFSTYHSSVDFSAVGKDVSVSSYDGKTTTTVNGTSFSAPVVSAEAARILSEYPDLTFGQVRGALKIFASTLPEKSPRYAGKLGWGWIDTVAGEKISQHLVHLRQLKTEKESAQSKAKERVNLVEQILPELHGSLLDSAIDFMQAHHRLGLARYKLIFALNQREAARQKVRRDSEKLLPFERGFAAWVDASLGISPYYPSPNASPKYFTNARGMNEKYYQMGNGSFERRGTWAFTRINDAGDTELYRWGGIHEARGQALIDTSTLLATFLSPKYHNEPELLYYASYPAMNSRAVHYKALFDISRYNGDPNGSYGHPFNGGYFTNARGMNEKYLMSNRTSWGNSWMFLRLHKGISELYQWGGIHEARGEELIRTSQLVAKLPWIYYDVPESLTEAVPFLQLRYGGDPNRDRDVFFTNARGMNEKYYKLSDGNWFFSRISIREDSLAELYLWGGVNDARGEDLIKTSYLMTTLPRIYHDHPEQFLLASSSFVPQFFTERQLAIQEYRLSRSELQKAEQQVAEGESGVQEAQQAYQAAAKKFDEALALDAALMKKYGAAFGEIREAEAQLKEVEKKIYNWEAPIRGSPIKTVDPPVEAIGVTEQIQAVQAIQAQLAQGPLPAGMTGVSEVPEMVVPGEQPVTQSR